MQALQAQIEALVLNRKMTEEVAQQELKRVRAEEEAKTSRAIAEMNQKIREQQKVFDDHVKKLQEDMRRAEELAQQQRQKMAEDMKREQEMAEQRAASKCDVCGKRVSKDGKSTNYGHTSDGATRCMDCFSGHLIDRYLVPGKW